VVRFDCRGSLTMFSSKKIKSSKIDTLIGHDVEISGQKMQKVRYWLSVTKGVSKVTFMLLMRSSTVKSSGTFMPVRNWNCQPRREFQVTLNIIYSKWRVAQKLTVRCYIRLRQESYLKTQWMPLRMKILRVRCITWMKPLSLKAEIQHRCSPY